jgi:hypothetical protein
MTERFDVDCEPRTEKDVRTKAIQIPSDPTTLAHLQYRVLRALSIPYRVDSPCSHWLATGAINIHGAPRIRYGEGDTMMRRLAWALWRSPDGRLEADFVVRARCGVERCCKPDHLELIRGAVSRGTIGGELRGSALARAAS